MTLFDLTGRAAAIRGRSCGIGRELADSFAKAGAIMLADSGRCAL